ncbi:MAG: outer membrane protein transport protein [Balneolales bacterium]
MKKLCLIPLLLAFILKFPAQEASAQYHNDALRYTFELPGQDAANMGMGGASVALGQDFGSFIMNPATSAMGEHSYFSFGLGTRDVRETDTYLGQTREFSDTQTGITNFGLVFQAPTERGALSVGLGYSQTADFNRALSINALNEQSTITDFFLEAGDDFFEPAFNAYAIDTVMNGDNVEYHSSWRPPFTSEYVGVDQFSEMTERGQMGEYTIFAGTEFIENLFVGLSLNIPSGSYSYRRTFIEDQPEIENDYDIQTIFTDEEIDATVTGFNARIGAVYKILPWFNIGGSYTTQTNLQVTEDFSNMVNTTFTDGEVWEDDFTGSFDYSLTRPARVSVGAAIDDLNGFSATFSAERVDYSDIRLNLGDERVLERNENLLIQDLYQEVINYRAGIQYNIADLVKLRGGYAYYPTAQEETPYVANPDREYFSGGIGLGLGEGLTLDFSLQMGKWQDENILYDFTNDNGDLVGEFVDEDVRRFHGVLGLTFVF